MGCGKKMQHTRHTPEQKTAVFCFEPWLLTIKKMLENHHPAITLRSSKRIFFDLALSPFSLV
tara:strand:- start:68 stop:253 length:186 start_codon:yes stop_codon:yes gene_type:complete